MQWAECKRIIAARQLGSAGSCLLSPQPRRLAICIVSVPQPVAAPASAASIPGASLVDLLAPSPADLTANAKTSLDVEVRSEMKVSFSAGLSCGTYLRPCFHDPPPAKVRARVVGRSPLPTVLLCTIDYHLTQVALGFTTRLQVHAVENSPAAAAWAAVNMHRIPRATPVHLHLGTWLEPLAALEGRLAGVISNPPYIPPTHLAALQVPSCSSLLFACARRGRGRRGAGSSHEIAARPAGWP